MHVSRWLSLFGAGLLCVSAQVSAYQVDAPQESLRERNAERWNAEDKVIDRSLRGEKKPNVLLILTDDIGWGELGSYGGGKLRGTPTPNLDQLAADGMRLLQHYAEPSCTPTRVALMTGRLPVRTGLDEVLFPGQDKGLVADEYTLAEAMKDAGYRTAMFGKWHLGEHAEHQPTNQGFDYAHYTLYNGGPWPWAENSRFFDPQNETVGEVPYELDIPENYEEAFGIRIRGILRARRGEEPTEIARLSLEEYNRHENDLTDDIIRFIGETKQSGDPFFVYWASNANQVFACPPEERSQQYVDSGNCQAAQLLQHDRNVRRIRDKIASLGISDNTLIIWLSDNGPMYSFYPSAGFSYLRGHKHEVYEGGVRTPAIVVWPKVVQPGNTPMDLVHVTDWFTTLARIAGVEDRLPADRVIDGVDQTALLVNGEGHSRRDYLIHYEYPFFGARGAFLSAVRMGDIKIHLAKKPIEVYNIKRDPTEQFSLPSKYLWALLPARRMVWEHEFMMRRFPNRKLEETVGSRFGQQQ